MENNNTNREQEQLIIPTQNIAFAAMKDGSFYCGVKEDDKESVIEFAQIFRALKAFIKTTNKKQISALSLVFLIEGSNLGETIIKRLEELVEE